MSDLARGDIGAVLFDFFGTLVDYTAAVDDVAVDHAGTYLGQLGHSRLVVGFPDDWNQAHRALDQRYASSRREYSMEDVAVEYARRVDIGLTPVQRTQLVAAFMSDWESQIVAAPGVVELLDEMRRCCRVGIVSNTHDPLLVPRLIERFGFGEFDPLVLSIEVGYRKPHASIYAVALSQLDIDPAVVLFVGDNYEHDVEGPRRVGMQSVEVTAATTANLVRATAGL